MSSILKEPYQISVWEDELIPEEVQHHIKQDFSGSFLDDETYNGTGFKENYILNAGETLWLYKNNPAITMEPNVYEQKIENGELSSNADYKYEKIIREHFEESRGLIIGANDMDSPYAAVNSSLKTNVNGSSNLTFTIYYKVFDPDAMDFVINPLAAAVMNERKIKLHFRDKWYDMVIKNCVEDSTAYSFTYTCSDIYINELSKNGFKVELDTELENNQGTVTKVAGTILEGTDWHVAPIEEEAPVGYEGPYSDIIVQTNIEPIYQGILNQTITVEPVNDFTPDEYADMKDQDGYVIDEETGKKSKTSFTIPKGEVVFMFYSDITKNAEQPQILYRKGATLETLQEIYARDINEDIITNAYNYRVISPEVLYVDKASSYDVPNIFYSENDSSFEICDWARGEKVIRSTKTGYDPDLDQFITVYHKKDENGNIILENGEPKVFYGYTTLDSISSDLAMNYLANSDNFIGIDTGWIFDGTPSTMDDAGDGTTVTGSNPNSEDATFTGQIYLLNQEGFSYDAANEGGAESVLIMKLEDGNDEHFYRDNNGDFYKITEVVEKNDGTTDTETKVEYIKLGSSKADAYEAQIAAEYKRLRTKGDERFASMSDDELQRTIDGALRNARYSTRIRRAVNTGVAANRKQIESLAPNEEYIFAVSLGQYKEGEEPPKYGDEIKYGAKTPTELYTFEDVTDSETILKKVREEAYTQAVAEIKNHPTRYLNTDQYGNITDEVYLKVYNNYLAEKEAEYTAIYLDDFGLLKNLMHEGTIDINERGGKRFREEFKKGLTNLEEANAFPKQTVSLLNDCKNFDTDQIYVKEIENSFTTTIDGKEIVTKYKTFVTITKEEYESITDEKEKELYIKKTFSFAQQLYEGLKTSFFNYGWAPAEEAKQYAEANTNDFVWFFIENSWEQSGNDGTFPEYKEDSLMFTDDSEINSFCDILYVELIKSIYDKYITTVFDTDKDGTLDDPTTAVIIPTAAEIAQIVDDVFEDLVDRVGVFGALKAAYEYKKPSILNSKGGDKYRQHLARWQKDGHEVALYAAFHSEPFASKYSYGNPEFDEDGKVVQDNKTTSRNEFGGQPEVIYLTAIEKERIEIKKEFDEKCSPAYIGTDDYYKVLDNKYFEAQRDFDSNELIYYKEVTDEIDGKNVTYTKWLSGEEYKQLLADTEINQSEKEGWKEPEYEKVDYLCGWGFTSLYLKYKEAEFNEAAQVATFTISREEYPLNKASESESEDTTIESPIVPKQKEDGSWDITNKYKTSSDEAKYFAYEDDVNGYYIFDKETEKIRLYNPSTDREKPTYLPIKDNDGGNYIYDAEREVYRRYRGWLTTEYRDPKTGEYLPQIQGGLPGDIIRHDMAWFDGHIGDWDEIPTRYQMVRTYEDEEDRLYLDNDIKVEWTLQANPTNWQKFCEIMDFDSDFKVNTRYYNVFKTYAAGYQLDHFYEDEDGYYVRMDGGKNLLEQSNDKVVEFFDELFNTEKIKEGWKTFWGKTEEAIDKMEEDILNAIPDWLKFGETDANWNTTTYSNRSIETGSKLINALLWPLNQIIDGVSKIVPIPVLDLTEDGLQNMKGEGVETPDQDNPFYSFFNSRFGFLYEQVIMPLAKALGISLSDLGVLTSNDSNNENYHFENQPYFLDLSKVYEDYPLPEGFYIPNFNNSEALAKAIQSGTWEYQKREVASQYEISLMSDENTDQSETFEPLTDNIFNINKGDQEGKNYETNSIGSVQYVKYRWWNWRHWGKKRYNLKEKLCVPVKSDSLDEFKVYNSIRDGASKNYSVVPVNKNEEINAVKYTVLDKTSAADVAKGSFNKAITENTSFWAAIADGMSYWQPTDDPLIFEHEFEELDWWKRDWDILSNLSISYLVKYRFCIATGACWGVYKNGYITSLPDKRIPGFETFEFEYEEDGTTKTETKEITTDIYIEYFKDYIETIDPKTINSDETEIKEYKYSVPNPPHLGSSNFLISAGKEAKEGFYLQNKTIAYRTLQESDFEPDTYFMWYDEEIEDTHYTYNSYLNYFRPYDKHDREIELGDGHFGLWVQTFTPVPALNQDLETKVIAVFDEYGVFLRYLDESGYDEEKGEHIKEATYDSTWLPVDNILIPYEKRLYNAGKRHFRRVRSTSNYSSFGDWELDNLFTYCNGEYMSLREYYEKNTKISHLDYNGLKVYFTPHYEYNPEHFSLEINQEPYDEYLGLQILTEPEGYFDTTVLNQTIIEDEVKERWGYWKIGVNKGYSLTDDLLSSIGIVFEKAEDAVRPLDKNGNDEDFAFLGMQLFKYIPYRSNKREEISENLEQDIKLTFKWSDEGVWILESDKQLLQEKIEDMDLPKVSTQLSSEINIKESALEFYKYLQEYLDVVDGYIAFDGVKLYITEDDKITQDERDTEIKALISIVNKYYETTEISFDGVTTETLYKEITKEEYDNPISLGNARKVIIKAAEIQSEFYQIKREAIRRPIIPGEAPDARDLTLTTYCIYDPELEDNDKPESAIFDYRGQYPEEEGYEVVYDELCQKIRSIKGRESNYFKLLQECCDTFDCWMEVIVDHDEETGRVNYEERKVYTKKTNEPDPQQYFDNLPEGEEESDYTVEYMIVPKKTVRFKRFVGKENWSGFKYGVNLKHIKRTIDSNQIATRIIVKPNKNEFATDGFCTIQRADENFIKENFIYDFSYYINKKMLDYGQVLQDLYTDVGSNLGYYRKLGRLNKENDQLIIDIASVIVELDKVKADYETAVLGRDAANEEIQKLMQILTSNYDTYGNIELVPWEYNKAKEYEQKTSTTAPARPGVEVTNSEGQTYIVNIPATTTELEYPKYNETLRTYFDQMDTYMRSHINFSKQVVEFGKRKEELEAKRDELLALEQEIIAKKKELNKIFFVKYARFIQEGSWIDEKYMDDNLYYLDALAVLRNSCSPKITYDIGVVDLYAAVEFEEDRPVLEFELGDRTYVEDVEFFGYAKNDKPYQEQIVIAEKTYLLDDASQNQIKVKNYSTQFDNLFQRAAAATQTLQFNEGSYGRASTILNSDGTINQNVLQQSVTDANLILANSMNENVLWDNTGITVTSYSQRSNVIKIVSAGIMLSKDGGNSYLTAITGDGVNAAVITGGMLNVDKLMIGASSTPNFLWNRAGISAFKTSDEGIDYSTFVRLDQYGVYGIKDWSKNDTPIDKMTINDTFEPLKLEDITNNNNAIFGLTWDGFFLNTVTEQGRGRVTIGTSQDFRMSVFDEDIGWQDRVIIGSMSDILTGEKTYGFRLVNADGEIVMDTNLRGELYLKRKLRISNFANETSYNPGLFYDEYGNVRYNPEQVSSSNMDDRVTLGIVDIYERTGEGTFAFAEPEGIYKSSQYLTKVLSIKANDVIGDEQFIDNPRNLGLVADNETFAIFDNGNLYAKNAWIEGHIRATSGLIGNLEIADGALQTKEFDPSSLNGWRIDDEMAYLNNATFRGTIKSSFFEYGEVQTVGGALLIRPSAKILDSYKYTYVNTESENIQNYIMLILTSTASFTKQNYCRIGSLNEGIILYIEDIREIWYNIETGKFEGEESFEEAFLNKEITDVSNWQKKTVLQCSSDFELDFDETSKQIIDKTFNSDVTDTINATIYDIGNNIDSQENLEIGFGINSGVNDSALPKQSISLFTTGVQKLENQYSWKREMKILLGEISKINTTEFSKEVAEGINYLQQKNSYGLYADNVYLKGSIQLNSNNGTSAGIDTNSQDKINSITGGYEFTDDNGNAIDGKIVFFGKKDNNYNFAVDEYGHLFAKGGYFSGTLNATTIETARIVGNGIDTALIVEAAENSQNPIIVFQTTDKKQVFSFDNEKISLNYKIISSDLLIQSDTVTTYLTDEKYTIATTNGMKVEFSKDEISFVSKKNEVVASIDNDFEVKQTLTMVNNIIASDEEAVTQKTQLQSFNGGCDLYLI